MTEKYGISVFPTYVELRRTRAHVMLAPWLSLDKCDISLLVAVQPCATGNSSQHVIYCSMCQLTVYCQSAPRFELVSPAHSAQNSLVLFSFQYVPIVLLLVMLKSFRFVATSDSESRLPITRESSCVYLFVTWLESSLTGRGVEYWC